MKQNELLLLGRKRLKQYNIEDADIKAKKIMECVLKKKREELIIYSLEDISEKQQLEYEEKIEEIINGKPIQYITHNQEFMGLNFYVDENVLIPQPDTELLVETTLKLIEEQHTTKEKINILDLCTGSGCIGISFLKYLKNVQVTLSDISLKALEIAKKNAINNKVKSNIEFICSDLLKKMKGKQFNYIVSNPPYIETNIIPTLSPEVRQEPNIALNGGKDGLDFYRKILHQAPNYLKQNGYLLFEIGFNQGDKIIEIWSENKEPKLNLITKKPIKDLSGNDRVFIFQKSR